MDAAVNTVNYNERFITKVAREISTKFNFNVIQQRVLNDILYKCTQNVEIIALEKEEGDFLTYIDIYANSMRLEGLAPGTIRNKCYSLKELNRYLEKDINKISVADLKMYILHKQSNCKQSTLNTIITTIKAFFSFLCDEGYIEVNPSRKLKKVKEEKRLKKSLNDLTLEQVRLACNNKRDRALIEFAYSSGLRVSELVKLDINDLDFTSNKLSVVGKGNKERTIQLTAKAVEHLREYIRVYHSNSSKEAYLFSTTIKGVTDRMSVGNVQRIIKKYAALVSEKGVSLPDSVHCHMFRRTRATNLYQDGIAIELVSTVLGHARTDTTKSYYAKPSVEQLRDAMESVPTPVSDEAPMWEGNEDEMARLCGLR